MLQNNSGKGYCTTCTVLKAIVCSSTIKGHWAHRNTTGPGTVSIKLRCEMLRASAKQKQKQTKNVKNDTDRSLSGRRCIARIVKRGGGASAVRCDEIILNHFTQIVSTQLFLSQVDVRGDQSIYIN